METQTEAITSNTFLLRAQPGVTTGPPTPILSEKLALVGGVLLISSFAIPLLIVIQILSGLYWGGLTVYKVLSGTGFDEMDAV